MSRNDKGEKKSCLDGICSVLCQIDQPEQMTRFLEEILTPAEQKDLSLRWQLMKMLLEGIPQRHIAAELGISLCKITRGAKILKSDNSISKRYLNNEDEHGPKNSTE